MENQQSDFEDFEIESLNWDDILIPPPDFIDLTKDVEEQINTKISNDITFVFPEDNIPEKEFRTMLAMFGDKEKVHDYIFSIEYDLMNIPKEQHKDLVDKWQNEGYFRRKRVKYFK